MVAPGRSVPAGRSLPIAGEHLLHQLADLDHFEVAGQRAVGVQVGDLATGRYTGLERQLVAVGQVAVDVGGVVGAGQAEVVEPEAVGVDVLLVHRRMVVGRLDQLDLQVSGVAHRQGDAGEARLTAVHRIDTGEVVEEEPRTDVQVSRPTRHCRGNVGDHVRQLHDPTDGLPGAELVHRSSSSRKLLRDCRIRCIPIVVSVYDVEPTEGARDEVHDVRLHRHRARSADRRSEARRRRGLGGAPRRQRRPGDGRRAAADRPTPRPCACAAARCW